MSLSWQTVSVFVSSTFNDMHAERDYLVKRVFPELREWCEQRKLRLIDIDLRWGITEADATNKNVVQVCLNRIDDCRPFFLCFLGQRRGWVPGKHEIAPGTCTAFPDLKHYIGDASITEMEILHAIINPMNKKERADRAFFYLRDPSYLDDLPDEPAFFRNTYTNEGIQDAAERKIADDQLRTWREETIPITGRPVRHYSATWNPEERTPELALPLQRQSEEPEILRGWMTKWHELGIHATDEDLNDEPVAEEARRINELITRGRLGSFRCDDEDLAAVILDDLKAAISTQFPEHLVIQSETPLQKELDQQEQFLELNCQGFIERKGDFDVINRYVASDSQDLFVITAPGGMGKTMFLANWIRSFQKEHESERLIFYRFIGASDRSTTVDSLLRSLLEEMRDKGLFKEEIPLDPTELKNKLLGILATIGSNTKIVIVIDALNQLATGLSDIHWLPRKLPQGIQMIVSFKQDEEESEKLAVQLQRVLPETFTSILPFESKDDRKKLVSAYLDQYLKQLDEQLIDILIDSPGASNPLYLKVVLSEIRVYGSFDNLGVKIGRDFGETPKEAFGGVLGRLEQDPAFTVLPMDDIVPLLFGLLSHARVGLAESEFVDLFVHELSCTRDDARDTIRLIFRQVRPFLASRGGRFDFFYESFRLAAMNRYDGSDNERNQRELKEWHQILADYFEHLPVWESREENRPTLRRAAELPFHLVWSGNGKHLADLIHAYELLETIVFGLGPEISIDNISLVLSPPVPQKDDMSEEQGNSLRLIQGALRLSAYILAYAPRQLPSQMVGRLLGSENPVVKAFVERINQFDKYPWLRPVLPSLIPPGGPLIRTLAGHSDYVNGVAVTPDGQRVVSTSGDKTLKVWDINSGRELATLAGHSDSVQGVAVTPDGQRVVSASLDHTLKVWDINSGRELTTLAGHSDYVNGVTVTPDGQRVVSASYDNTLKVWDINSGRELTTLAGHSYDVEGVAATPDGQRAVSASRDHTLKVWDINSGRELTTLAGHSDGVREVAVTPDGQRVVSASYDNTLKVWDINSGRELATLAGHSDEVRGVAVTPDGERAVSASYRTLKVWDINSGRELATLAGHSGWVRGVAVTPDEQRVVSASEDHTLKVWDLDNFRELATLAGHTCSVRGVAVTPDGQRVVSASEDTTLKVWDINSGRELALLAGHSNWVEGIAVTPDGQKVVSASGDKTLKVWDINSGRELATLAGHSYWVRGVTVTPDGQRVVSASADHTLKVWDINSGRELTTLVGHSGGVHGVAVTPDGQRVVSGYDDATLKVWDINSGRELATLAGHTWSVMGVAVTPDGQRVVSTSGDNTLKVWDINSGRELATLVGHSGVVEGVAVTPDGERIVSASLDTTLKVWDLESGTIIAEFYCEGMARACGYSKIYHSYIAGDASGRIYILHLEGIS